MYSLTLFKESTMFNINGTDVSIGNHVLSVSNIVIVVSPGLMAVANFASFELIVLY